MNKQLILIAKLLMSAAILAWLFYQAWKTDQFSELSRRDIRWPWLLGAGLTCLAAHVVGYVRWRIMVISLGMPFRIRDAIRIGLAGSFFNLFAFGVVGGDGLRAFYVSRQFPQRISEAITSVVADRLIGMLTMFTFASVAFFMIDLNRPGFDVEKLTALRVGCWFIVVATIIGFLGVLIAWHSPRLIDRGWVQPILKWPLLGTLARKFVLAMELYRGRPGAVAGCFALSGLVNVFFIITIFLVAGSLDQAGPGIDAYFLIAPLSMVANAVPLPGGLGGMELMLDFLYRLFSPAVENPPSVLIAFTFRFLLLSVSAFGAIAWTLDRRSINAAVSASHQ